MNKIGGGVKGLGGRAALLASLLLLPLVSQAQPTPPPPTFATPIATALPTPDTTATPSKTPAGTPAPTPTPTPPAKPLNLGAQAYRARLQADLQRLEALQKRRPRRVKEILQRLDATITVRRDDGQTQQVKGNLYSNLAREIANHNDAKRVDVAKLKNLVKTQLDALDEWLKKPPYQSIDAKKIVSNLESTGQIRTKPLWWQQLLVDGWKAIAKAWSSFMDWLNSLLPKPKAPNLPSAPSDRWLWILFYIFVLAILGAVIWFTWRIFGGQKWGRTVRRDVALENEDAQLLLLPPEELRSRADIYADQGNYREALRHRYLALLLHLDTRGVWRYDSHRTNWEHIAALRRRDSDGTLVTPLAALTRRFDRVRYGGAPCDSEQWQQFDADARSFEAQTASSQHLTGAVR